MKHARKWLACLLAGALALAVLAGCSALMGGTVQKDTEQAKALMKEVDPSLTYNTDLVIPIWKMQPAVWQTGWWRTPPS